MTGTSLCTYKGSSSSSQTLALVGKDYLISGVSNKPLIHVWLLQKREQIQQRLVVPGRVSALAVSPDGLYCVAAVQELIHVWQVSTGNLLAVLDKHYQRVTCIRFTDDGSHFVTGGADNLVLVWSFSSVVSASRDSNAEPRHMWSDHSLPVSDVHVGHGGVKARVYTASLDHTCKIYELCSGALLMNLVFDCAVTSLVVDSPEQRLFAGGGSGTIYQVNLFTSPTRTEQHITEGKDADSPVFRAHTKAVTCLALSLDGHWLVSGSHDCSVRVWDIPSQQCIRTLLHKGAVTNVLLSHVRPTLEHYGSRVLQPFQAFKRYLHGTEQSEDQHGADDGTVPVVLNSLTQFGDTGDDSDDVTAYIDQLGQRQRTVTDDVRMEGDHTGSLLQDEVARLKTVNKQMYDFALNKIAATATSPMSPS